MLALVLLIAVVSPAFAQVEGATPGLPNTASTGCQPGQVLFGNGQSCVPPVSLPAPPLNVIGLTPAEMSRQLSPPSTPTVTPVPTCQPGQVLQPNGQPCTPGGGGTPQPAPVQAR